MKAEECVGLVKRIVNDLGLEGRLRETYVNQIFGNEIGITVCISDDGEGVAIIADATVNATPDEPGAYTCEVGTCKTLSGRFQMIPSEFENSEQFVKLVNLRFNDTLASGMKLVENIFATS